jgi:peptidoglycan/LPS O-acetylase OafA/YrhL
VNKPLTIINRDQIAPLTGIRIVAAFAILAFHYWANHASPLIGLFSIGFVGVNLAFVLSGFILVYNYYGKNTPAREFYWRRFIRIYPTYLLALIGTLILIPVVFPPMQFALEALLINGFIPGYNGLHGINVADWAIVDEAFFYAVFPALLVIAERKSVRFLLLLVTITWALSIILPTLLFSNNGPIEDGFIIYNPLISFSEFLMGAVAGACWIRYPGVFQHWKRLLFYTLIMGSTIVAVLVGLYPLMLDSPLRLALRIGLLSPLFTVIILYLAQGKSRLATFLSLPPMMLLGGASYAVFLYGSTLGLTLSALFKQLGASGLIAELLSFGGIVGLSILSFRFFETPLRVWLRRLVRPGKAVCPLKEGIRP